MALYSTSREEAEMVRSYNDSFSARSYWYLTAATSAACMQTGAVGPSDTAATRTCISLKASQQSISHEVPN